jgi:hypothetical protein
MKRRRRIVKITLFLISILQALLQIFTHRWRAPTTQMMKGRRRRVIIFLLFQALSRIFTHRWRTPTTHRQ